MAECTPEERAYLDAVLNAPLQNHAISDEEMLKRTVLRVNHWNQSHPGWVNVWIGLRNAWMESVDAWCNYERRIGIHAEERADILRIIDTQSNRDGKKKA